MRPFITVFGIARGLVSIHSDSNAARDTKLVSARTVEHHLSQSTPEDAPKQSAVAGLLPDR